MCLSLRRCTSEGMTLTAMNEMTMGFGQQMVSIQKKEVTSTAADGDG